MRDETLLQGMITGIEKLGATFIKMDNEYIYIEFKKGAEIDNPDKLKRAKDAFQQSFGIGLKIKKTN